VFYKLAEDFVQIANARFDFIEITHVRCNFVETTASS
jgi:hypothetical protein